MFYYLFLSLTMASEWLQCIVTEYDSKRPSLDNPDDEFRIGGGITIDEIPFLLNSKDKSCIGYLSKHSGVDVLTVNVKTFRFELIPWRRTPYPHKIVGSVRKNKKTGVLEVRESTKFTFTCDCCKYKAQILFEVYLTDLYKLGNPDPSELTQWQCYYCIVDKADERFVYFGHPEM